jgi:hypothetical protein
MAQFFKPQKKSTQPQRIEFTVDSLDHHLLQGGVGIVLLVVDDAGLDGLAGQRPFDAAFSFAFSAFARDVSIARDLKTGSSP